MNTYYLRTNLMIATAAIAVGAGIYRYSKFDRATKLFFYFAVCSFLEESLAYYWALRYNRNTVVYNITNIIEIFIVSLYFNYAISFFRKRNIGIIIGAFSVAFGIINNFFIQSPNSITNYFLFYQALVTIAMCIILLSTFMVHSYTGNVKKEVHFWLAVILMFCWSFCYLVFTLMKYYTTTAIGTIAVVTLTVVGIITNLSIAVIFYLYPKMNTYVR
jgi:hypothetical protein